MLELKSSDAFTAASCSAIQALVIISWAIAFMHSRADEVHGAEEKRGGGLMMCMDGACASEWFICRDSHGCVLTSAPPSDCLGVCICCSC